MNLFLDMLWGRQRPRQTHLLPQLLLRFCWKPHSRRAEESQALTPAGGEQNPEYRSNCSCRHFPGPTPRAQEESMQRQTNNPWNPSGGFYGWRKKFIESWNDSKNNCPKVFLHINIRSKSSRENQSVGNTVFPAGKSGSLCSGWGLEPSQNGPAHHMKPSSEFLEQMCAPLFPAL